MSRIQTAIYYLRVEFFNVFFFKFSTGEPGTESSYFQRSCSVFNNSVNTTQNVNYWLLYSRCEVSGLDYFEHPKTEDKYCYFIYFVLKNLCK